MSCTQLTMEDVVHVEMKSACFTSQMKTSLNLLKSHLIVVHSTLGRTLVNSTPVILAMTIAYVTAGV